MQKLLLVLGIPAVFVIGIVAYETGQLLWLGLAVPFAVLRYFIRRNSRQDDFISFSSRERPQFTDSNHTSQSSRSE